MIASSELRRRQERHPQGLVITAKKLAGFLQSVENDELLMAQRMCDQEAQATRNALSVVQSTQPSSGGRESEPVEGDTMAPSAERADSAEVYGEFLNGIASRISAKLVDGAVECEVGPFPTLHGCPVQGSLRPRKSWSPRFKTRSQTRWSSFSDRLVWERRLYGSKLNNPYCGAARGIGTGPRASRSGERGGGCAGIGELLLAGPFQANSAANE